MKHRLLFALLVLVCATTLPAQERGAWRAASKPASAITGDIALSTDKLSINFASFPVAQIRPMQPAELKAAFDLDSVTGTGSLYKLNIPEDKRFLHKNTLCGAESTQWMVAYVVGHNLQLAFFSGQKVPEFTAEAVMSTTNLCGTFSYVK